MSFPNASSCKAKTKVLFIQLLVPLLSWNMSYMSRLNGSFGIMVLVDFQYFHSSQSVVTPCLVHRFLFWYLGLWSDWAFMLFSWRRTLIGELHPHLNLMAGTHHLVPVVFAALFGEAMAPLAEVLESVHLFRFVHFSLVPLTFGSHFLISIYVWLA